MPILIVILAVTCYIRKRRRHSRAAGKKDVGGCCAVTKQDCKGGATVARGPDWKWSDQDGGAGNTGILALSLDSVSWVSVRWTGGVSKKYWVSTAQDLVPQQQLCLCQGLSRAVCRGPLLRGHHPCVCRSTDAPGSSVVTRGLLTWDVFGSGDEHPAVWLRRATVGKQRGRCT